MNKWILAMLALTIAACGGEEGGSGQQPSAAVVTGGDTGAGTGSTSSGGGIPSGDPATGGTTGDYPGGDLSGGFTESDLCYMAISVFWCGSDAGSGGSSGSTASAVHSKVSDTEPNNDVGNAVIVHWPVSATADQRIGFGVEGSVDAAGDVADFFAFTPWRSADFIVSLCETGQVCGPWTANDRLPVAVATVRVMNEYGIVILSETLYPGSGNVFETRFESGVLYYVAVVAEGMAGGTQPYRLSVGESLQQTAAADLPPPASAPQAPDLAAFVSDANMNVQLDWTIPLYNVDGTQLSDLTGFNVYLYDYIREGDTAERMLIETIDDPMATTRTLNLEGYRDWYVSITAFNDAGIESAHSNGVELSTPPE